MRKITIAFLFLIVSITWGTTWLAMKIVVGTIPPIFATGMRFIFSAPFLILICWLNKSPLLFPRGQRFFQLYISIFYFAIPFTLMIYGETYVSSGLAAIIFSNMPVAVLIASMILMKEKTNIKQISGLTIAILSLAIIIFDESKSSNESHWQGLLAIVFAVVFHAIIYTQCKIRSCTVSVVTFNALPCLLAGIILLSVGWFFEKPIISGFSKESIISTFYLGAFAGVFGILCYFSLQKKAKAFQASLVFLIFPVIAVSLEDYLYGYNISRLSMLMLIPLISGVFITLSSSSKVRS